MGDRGCEQSPLSQPALIIQPARHTHPATVKPALRANLLRQGRTRTPTRQLRFVGVRASGARVGKLGVAQARESLSSVP